MIAHRRASVSVKGASAARNSQEIPAKGERGQLRSVVRFCYHTGQSGRQGRGSGVEWRGWRRMTERAWRPQDERREMLVDDALSSRLVPTFKEWLEWKATEYLDWPTGEETIGEMVVLGCGNEAESSKTHDEGTKKYDDDERARLFTGRAQGRLSDISARPRRGKQAENGRRAKEYVRKQRDPVRRGRIEDGRRIGGTRRARCRNLQLDERPVGKQAGCRERDRQHGVV